MYKVDVKFNESFFKKTDSKLYIESAEDTISYLAEQYNQEVKNEAPVRTGRLRDGHTVQVDGLQAYILNNVEYASYVIYGTSRQAPNNYPQRVANRMNLSGVAKSRFEESLITNGLL